MPVDPQMQEVLDQLDRMRPAPVEKLTPQLARHGPTPADAVKQLLLANGVDPTPQSVDRVEDATIAGMDGEIAIRLYAPFSETPLPVVVYWHGGGWVLGDLDTYDSTCRSLANAARCIVVAGDYRQGPEDPFPAAVEDAYTAYAWVHAQIAEYGGDPTRIVVAGESAGGNLAAVVCQVAYERGDALPLLQLLVYPVVDHDFDTPSMREFTHRYGKAIPLTREGMQWFWNQYFADVSRRDDPHASPLRAPDLGGLPPALIVLAEIDPLRSEGERYAERLRAAGVHVDVHEYAGVTHEFFGMTAYLDRAREAMPAAARVLRAAFGEPSELALAQVEVDAEVLSADGQSIGRVKLVRQGDFLVDRQLRRDVFVPLVSVRAVSGTVELALTADQIGEADWPKPLPVKPPARSV